MFYYAYIDITNTVTGVYALPSAITADGYIAITEQQYNDSQAGNENSLIGKVYNSSTGEFEDPDYITGSSNEVEYKDTETSLTAKLDSMDTSIATNTSNIATFETNSHTHDNKTVLDGHDTDYFATAEQLAGKANSDHTHTEYTSANHTHTEYATVAKFATVETAVNGKANLSHTHAQSEITGLTTALSGKANSSHSHNEYALATDLATVSEVANGKANASHSHSLDEVTETTAKKIMTSAERTKLSGIETGANKITVDSAMSSSSTNPVQNKVVNTALGNKVDKVNGKGLSTNDYTIAEKTKLAGSTINFRISYPIF